MLRKTYRILLAVFCISLSFTIFAQASFAEVNDDYALKISLENQIEKKLKQVIVEITGTDRVVIFVNAELVTARGDDKRIKRIKGDALVLPGVPEKKEIGSGQTEMAFGSGSSKYKVNKIVLSIWIDKSVPGSIVDLIQDIAKNVIGFSQNRGDQINVKKVDFESKGFFGALFALPNFFWFILTLVGGFMLVTVGLFFMDPLKKIVPALKNIDWGLIRGTGDSGKAERTVTYEQREVVSGRAGTSASEPVALAENKDAALPFSFVRERDIPSLAFLLKDKTAQDIAIAINYLDPAISMRLLELFPMEKQVEIAVILGNEEINMEKVHALEEMVKNKLTYVVGGENKLLSLLDMTSEDVRDKIVKTLETRDAQTATRLKSKIKSLEAIIRELPAPGIQALYRNIDVMLFAQILKASPEDIQQKAISSLSTGAAERLKEEMELSRPLSGVRLRREKQNLMVLVRRLISEGLVEVENN